MRKILLCSLLLLTLCSCGDSYTKQQSVTESVFSIRTYTPEATSSWSNIIILPTIQPLPTPTAEIFIITAYDLSIQSCGKSMRHREYGITRRGDCIRGKTRNEAMAVAVDPKFIPLGAFIKIEFLDTEYQKYNGIYHAIDTGSAVKGHIIDLFMGDFQRRYPAKETDEFGSAKANVTIISEGD